MTAAAPLGLLAELTHACPLHCPYCSNPLALTARDAELSTADWLRVFAEAAALGVAQVHLSGGEPLLRRDLPELAAGCRDLGLYTNLITSGLGTVPLADLPVDHVQLSIQDAAAANSDLIAGTRSWAHKVEAARAVKRAGLPLTVNVVLHRHNLDHLAEIFALAERLGADRLELAHTQYYGWGRRNRSWLVPTADQIRAADDLVRGTPTAMELTYVRPDLHDGTPKKCTEGWGQRQLTIAPDGSVLPCASAAILPLPVENVLDRPLAWIWYSSDAFNRFRGTAWMPEPCRSCALKEVDFGGCRCQAYALTGDASATDPACRLSPDRDLARIRPGDHVVHRPHAPKGTP